MQTLSALVISAVLLGLGAWWGLSGRQPTPPVASALAWKTVAEMGPGINFGNMLEAPQEGDWGLRAEPAYIAAAWQAGFRTVRLPVRWSNHAAATAPYAIDPPFLDRVEAVVDALLAQGFVVVLDMHHHRQLDGDALDKGEFAVDPLVLEARFVAMWSHIATRFASKSERLLFELYNEPHGRQTAQSWNALAATALQAVRQTNPQRLVVLSPVDFGNASALARLSMPQDPHLLATFHHYEPFGFTHQGATWVTPTPPTGVTCCNAEQAAQIEAAIAQAKAWSQASGYPIFMGEFGSISLADMDSRVAYTRAVRAAARAHQVPWVYWEFASTFGVYDPATGQFRPELAAALLGP